MGQGLALKPRELKRREVLQAGAAASLAAAALSGCQQERDALAQISGGFTGVAHARGHVLRESALPPFKGGAVRSVHTLIAGGGVAGLSAARALRMQGVQDFALIELEDEAGGNARAGQMAGMVHPIGAHYLPTPGDDAPEVQDFLQEIGVRKQVAGRWQYDERALCHSPQERLFFNGQWQDGLLPMQGVSAQTLQQYQRFAQLVSQWQKTGAFSMPLRPGFMQKLATVPALFAQAATKFVAYLDTEQLTDAHLRWYLDYCCRDDYGAGIDSVSTFAGIHYFAARHGFHAPGDAAHSAERDKDAVLTWPQGNGFLTQALAQPLGERLLAGHVVLRIEETARGVQLDALHMASGEVRRWQAKRCIVALPLHVAARVVLNAPDFLKAAAAQVQHASWWVANIQLDAPLHDNGQGAHPSWDNVIYASAGLGYVDAMHQSTRIAPGPTVLTYYKAEGAGIEPRRRLLQSSWQQLRDEALREIAVAHPDITRRAQRIDITRYGHAMAVPTPEFIKQIGLQRPWNVREQLSKTKWQALNYASRPTPATARLAFAHSDWSGYSVFEEAFTRGMHSVFVNA